MSVANEVSANADLVRSQDAQEKAVGISVFVTRDAPGFTCIVKQRYTDFLVNEVLPHGEVLHPTESTNEGRKRKRNDDGEAPQKKARNEEMKAEEEAKTEESTPIRSETEAKSEQKSEEKTEDVAAAGEAAVASISEADKTALNQVFGESTTAAILKLYASVITHPHRKPRDHPSVQSEEIVEKSKRTEAHVVVRRVFDSKLTTLTVQDAEKQSGPLTHISIKAAAAGAQQQQNVGNGNTRPAKEPRGKLGWAELGGEYLHFTLYKENKDTMEVLYFLASQMKLHVKNFGFAGTKDRRGVTVQRVCAYRVKQERMESLNKFARGWRLAGPWEYKTQGLELGQLSGNQFLLTLRDAHFAGEQPEWSMQQRLENAQKATETAAKSLSAHGYLNYFGLQRFGTHSTGTHAVGMKMLKDDLKGAVQSILAYDEALLEENQPTENGADTNGESTGLRRKVPQEDIQRATALHNFSKDANSNKALSMLPNRFSAERGIVTHLGKRDRQSNTRPNENDWKGALGMIQRNLRLMYVHAYQSFIWNTVAGQRWETFGDKVVEGDLVVVGEKELEEGTPITNAPKKDEVDEAGEPIIHPTTSSGEVDTLTTSDDPYVRARPLSKDEAESGRYTIFDIVLPLPGFDVLYPSNSIGQFYKDFMASEAGGGLDPHNMRRSWKDISLSGSYRKMMTRPLGEVEVECRGYTNVEEQMVRTDLEKLEGRNEEVEKNGINGEGDKVAVLVKLNLASSQYATMALRELTKGGAVGFRPDYSVGNK